MTLGLPNTRLVSPGEVVSTDPSFIQGHGTVNQDQNMVSTLLGKIRTIDKLLCVDPVRSRYFPQVGDTIVGRIVHVAQTRWKIDINSHQLATLPLAAVNLTDGAQRRRLEADELKIRTFFVEGDILSAEIQTVHADGSASLQIRGKYGKQNQGVLVKVSCGNICRSKSQFHQFPGAVSIIVGINGYVWIGASLQCSVEERSNIARLRNCIKSMDQISLSISPAILERMYTALQSYSPISLSSAQIVAHIYET